MPNCNQFIFFIFIAKLKLQSTNQPEFVMSTQATLHYVYDPFCGWCYAAAPLLAAASELKGLKIVPHGGGMLAHDSAKTMSAEWRDFVRPHETRITALSGQVFGDAYKDGTQFDYDVVLDSAPPTAAMLAAEELAGAGLPMLKRLQTAYYLEGRHIADRAELTRLAVELGLDEERFSAAFERANSRLPAHFEDTRELLWRAGGRGFPTLAFEKDGVLELLHLGQFLGKPEQFREALESLMAPASTNA